MHSNKTREQVGQAYFAIWAIEVGIGVENDSLLILRFFLFIFIFHVPYVFYHLHVILTDFQTFPPPKKNSAFSAACKIQNWKL